MADSPKVPNKMLHHWAAILFSGKKPRYVSYTGPFRRAWCVRDRDKVVPVIHEDGVFAFESSPARAFVWKLCLASSSSRKVLPSRFTNLWGLHSIGLILVPLDLEPVSGRVIKKGSCRAFRHLCLRAPVTENVNPSCNQERKPLQTRQSRWRLSLQASDASRRRWLRWCRQIAVVANSRWEEFQVFRHPDWRMGYPRTTTGVL